MEKSSCTDTIAAPTNVHFTAALLAALFVAAFASCAGKGAREPAESDARTEPDGIPVTTVAPKIDRKGGSLSLAGTIRAETELTVSAETQGKILSVGGSRGMRVVRGDVLARIDDSLKQSSLRTAQAAYDKAKSDWAKAQGLFSEKVISDSDLQGAHLAFVETESRLLEARRDLENASVRAPHKGIITDFFVTPGESIAPGAPVARIADIDSLKMTVRASERDVLKIRVGMKAAIESDLYPDGPFAGIVAAIGPKGDEALTFPVDITLKGDPARPLYDGMSARASVKLGERSILAIPRASLVGDRKDPRVYVVRDGVARLTPIAIGTEYGTDIEVLSGLGTGDLVVTEGMNNLSDGARVLVADGGEE